MDNSSFFRGTDDKKIKALRRAVNSNGTTGTLQGSAPYALASVLYDVLDRVALDAKLGRAEAYEVDLAIEQLAHSRPGDLLVMDRNDPS